MKWKSPLGTFVAVIAIAIAGCAAFTSQTSLTPNEQEAAAVITAKQAVQSADTLLLAKKITPDEAAQLKTQADTLVAMVKTIRSLPPGSANQGTDLAQLAALTTALSTYVASLAAGGPK